MRKDDIKSTLDRIQPRQELIEDTIRRVNELRFKNKTSFFESFNLNFKLASAMCALFLVICVGIAAFNNGLFNDASNSPIASSDFRASDFASYYDESKITGDASDLISDARLSGGDWAVIYGVATSCYAQNDENGIYYLVQIDSPQICDHNLSNVDDYDFNSGTIAVLSTENEETVNDFLNLMSSPIFIRLRQEEVNGDVLWKIADFVPEK